MKIKYREKIGILLCSLMIVNALRAEILQTSLNIGANNPKSVSQSSITVTYVESHDIAPYGESIDINNSTFSFQSRLLNIDTNPFIYSQAYYDKETGLNYMKARYQNPALMRFISQDSEDLTNRYAYGNGDPINNFDPSGHITIPSWVNFLIAGVGVFLGPVELWSAWSAASFFVRWSPRFGLLSSICSLGAQSYDESISKEQATIKNTFSMISNISGDLGLGCDFIAFIPTIRNIKDRVRRYFVPTLEETGANIATDADTKANKFSDFLSFLKAKNKFALKDSNEKLFGRGLLSNKVEGVNGNLMTYREFEKVVNDNKNMFTSIVEKHNFDEKEITFFNKCDFSVEEKIYYLEIKTSIINDENEFFRKQYKSPIEHRGTIVNTQLKILKDKLEQVIVENNI